MAQSVRIEPDLQFVRELQAAGGESLKKCYQCATCSVACPISPESNPYPRKEMIWAQWGLKDKLLSDPDIWLCHNCGGCSDLCPRGAKPADLMSAMRNMAYKNLVPCASMGTWMSSAKFLPILIGIPAVLFGLIWFCVAKFNLWATLADSGFWLFKSEAAHGVPYGVFKAGSWLPEGEIVFGKLFYGDFTIDLLFGLTFLFMLATFVTGVRNLIKTIGPKGTVMHLGKKRSGLCCLIDVIISEIVTHKKFADCGTESEKATRKIGHMSLFYGFICLAVVTGIVAGGHWVGRIPGLEFLALHTPMPLHHPVKLLAIVGTLLLLGGLTLLTIRRKSLDPTKQTSSFYDWYLLGVIWVVGLTGLGSMLLRLADIAPLAYFVYYLHLVSVFMLFAYLPWSKLGHLVYRTAALTYVRWMGR